MMATTSKIKMTQIEDDVDRVEDDENDDTEARRQAHSALCDKTRSF